MFIYFEWKNNVRIAIERLPTMQKVINNEHELAATAQTFSISTVGGKQFTIFAKNKKWGKGIFFLKKKEDFSCCIKWTKNGVELYEDFVAPTFKDGLLVESWMNGVGKVTFIEICCFASSDG